ncbi:MAG: permease prefix domain 1-containing protein [Treponema sp.]|nr:permease prefix domain 1-containing protein [Treponema sp.]
MDAIETYIDNVFAAFAKTERALALKREMLASMEEKYDDLRREGKSEHEAVGAVIANFGSIEEIASELGALGAGGEAEPDAGVDLTGKGKAEKIVGIVTRVYWPAVTAAFLLWGFLGGGWATNWLIFPVAAVLRVVFLRAFRGGTGARLRKKSG